MSSPVWHYTTSVRARRHVNANIITSIPSSRPNLSAKCGKYISDVLWACIRPAFFDIKDFLPSHTLTLMQSQLHLILSNALILPCSPFDEACRCWQVCEENSENAGIWIARTASFRLSQCYVTQFTVCTSWLYQKNGKMETRDWSHVSCRIKK